MHDLAPRLRPLVDASGQQDTDDDCRHLEQYEKDGQLGVIGDVAVGQKSDADGVRGDADRTVVRRE